MRLMSAESTARDDMGAFSENRKAKSENKIRKQAKINKTNFCHDSERYHKLF